MKHFHAILATEMTIILVAVLYALVEISKTYPMVLIVMHLLLIVVILWAMLYTFKQNVFGKKKN